MPAAHAVDGATVAPPAARERILWVDAARALAVLGVVLFHIGFLHYQPQLAESAGAMGSAWNHVDGLLGSFRMPMLLMLSGMLASGKVRRGLRQGKALESSAANYYLYVVWLVVYLLTIWDRSFPLGVDGPVDLLRQLVLPDTSLWFVQCLSLGVLLLAACNRLRPAVVLVPLVLVHLVVNGLPMSDVMLVRTLPYYLYLALGVYLSGWVRRAAESVPATVVAGAGFVVSWVASQVLESRSLQLHAVVNLLACLCAAVFLMGATRLLCRWDGFARVAGAIGRRTLPIYVMHLPMVAAIRALPSGYAERLRELFAAQPVLALAYPLVLMIILAALCLGLEVVLKRIGLGFLFEMPEALRRHVRRPAPQAAGAVADPLTSRSVAAGGEYVGRHSR